MKGKDGEGMKRVGFGGEKGCWAGGARWREKGLFYRRRRVVAAGVQRGCSGTAAWSKNGRRIEPAGPLGRIQRAGLGGGADFVVELASETGQTPGTETILVVLTF
jgi:hypothetical protein